MLKTHCDLKERGTIPKNIINALLKYVRGIFLLYVCVKDGGVQEVFWGGSEDYGLIERNSRQKQPPTTPYPIPLPPAWGLN